MRRCIYKKIYYLTYDLDLGVKFIGNVAKYPQHHVAYTPTKFEVPTSYSLRGDAFTIKYILWPLNLTLESRLYKMLPSTLYIMWHMKLQSLKLLHPTVYKEMHLQENTLFDLLNLKVTWIVAQYPLHHVTYAAAKFEVATSNGLGKNAFASKYIIWPLTLTLGSRSHKMLPSTLYIMWHMQLQSLKLLLLTV